MRQKTERVLDLGTGRTTTACRPAVSVTVRVRHTDRFGLISHAVSSDIVFGVTLYDTRSDGRGHRVASTTARPTVSPDSASSASSTALSTDVRITRRSFGFRTCVTVCVPHRADTSRPSCHRTQSAPRRTGTRVYHGPDSECRLIPLTCRCLKVELSRPDHGSERRCNGVRRLNGPGDRHRGEEHQQ